MPAAQVNMDIFIQTMLGTELKVRVSTHDSIGDVKTQIQQHQREYRYEIYLHYVLFV